MDTILSVQGVSKSFGGVHAVRQVSIEVAAGQVLALVGDNGAGKSTLIKMISGVHHADEGRVVFRGQDITAATAREVRELGIETIYQDLALADNLDVSANIFLGREVVGKRLGLFPYLNRKHMYAEAREALSRLGIQVADVATRVRHLSGGQRQTIAISRAVYWQARLIIMDEPTAALGVPEQRELKDLIARLRDQGVAVIFISHNLGDIFDVADRIAVLERGRLAGERAPAETDADEIVKLMMGAEK